MLLRRKAFLFSPLMSFFPCPCFHATPPTNRPIDLAPYTIPRTVQAPIRFTNTIISVYHLVLSHPTASRFTPQLMLGTFSYNVPTSLSASLIGVDDSRSMLWSTPLRNQIPTNFTRHIAWSPPLSVPPAARQIGWALRTINPYCCP